MNFRKLGRAVQLIPEIVSVQMRHGLLSHLRSAPFLPRMLLFVSTHVCNAHCAMCGIWQERTSPSEEVSLNELERIVQDRLFSRLEYIGINGGEPFLRRDLLEVVHLFRGRCRRLKRISITTNGLATKQVESQVGRIADECRAGGVLLDISVSCHALGPLADRIYGVGGAFDKIRRTLDLLKASEQRGRLTLSLNCVLLKDNLDHADQLFDWARKQQIPVSFVVGEQRERFRNKEMGDAFVQSHQRADLLAFLARMRARCGRSPEGLRYRTLEGVLSGRPREMSCQYSLSGLLLGFDGGLYYCPHSRALGNCRERSAWEIFYDPRNLEYRTSELLKGECRRCPPYTLTRLELEKDIGRVIRYVLAPGWRTKRR